MSLTLTLPKEFSYVIGSLATIPYVLAFQTIQVSSNRKASGIKYPQLYAEKAEAEASPAAKKFNCAQRAHQNTLENVPTVVITTLIAGLKFPVAAASMCGIWALSRIIYTRGYVTGNPDKRNGNGAILGSFSVLGLLLASSYTAFDLVRKTFEM